MASPTFSPLYRQIKDLLLEGLRGGEWRPGEAIPSELELAGRFRVSQGTVRKAIDELAAENLLVRRQGKGTFVATHGEPQVRFRFLRLTPDSGEAVAAQRELLDFRRARASAELARLLELKPGEQVIMLKRRIAFDGSPVLLEEVWLPGNRFKGVTAAAVTEHQGALYNLFETEYGTRMVRAEERLKAVSADAGAAELLGVEPGHALLQVERLSFTYGDTPVEWRKGVYNTDRHYYRSELG
ncbi:MAG: GntR family transcriptional regulator [Betaproteobacteria bacterium SG8_39]|nr:MAG: GntR family transcriptional regulator [Betaproteobacteria bacterium SG8_39]